MPCVTLAQQARDRAKSVEYRVAQHCGVPGCKCSMAPRPHDPGYVIPKLVTP